MSTALRRKDRKFHPTKSPHKERSGPLDSQMMRLVPGAKHLLRVALDTAKTYKSVKLVNVTNDRFLHSPRIYDINVRVDFKQIAVLACRAFPASPGLRTLPFAFSICLVILIAIIDETNQSFTSARTGSTYDVLLDLVGGPYGIVLFKTAAAKIRRHS